MVSRDFTFDGSLGTTSVGMSTQFDFGGPQDPGDEWDLKKLNITYGLADDPIDENLSWGLYWAVRSSDNPDFRNDIFVWQARQNYRILTSVGAVKTIDFASVDLSQKKAHEATPFDNEALFIGLRSSVSNSAFDASGNLTYEQTLLQVTTRDDPSEYEPDFLFEEALDEEEGDNNL